MRDFSINLPSWAVREGYSAQGSVGTYGELFLYKHRELIRWWDWGTPSPNIFEMEEIIANYKSKEVTSGC